MKSVGLTPFINREDAGRKLGQALAKFKGRDLLVLGIPRGGVIVAVAVAKELKAPLSLIIPRKLRAPQNPELAIGAVAEKGKVILNQELVQALKVPALYIEAEVQYQLNEVERRKKLYLGAEKLPDFKEKTVIIVDDGLATGYTAWAAVEAVKAKGPKEVVLAVPVAPPDTVKWLIKQVNELICLATPEPFFAVGQFYQEFSQVTDAEVIKSIKGYKSYGGGKRWT